MMTSNGMYENCVCRTLTGKPSPTTKLTLLSSIPNQRIYRCSSCHSFLAYTEDKDEWEVIMQGDLEEELKSLYCTTSTQSQTN
ncbi:MULTISPECIES: hypothetical protein [unclassified Neptuniibacter]|uniref:hypothetical protein n=1 Tax=unclassified Neptuniibacter TaxID=2630693 RepID=UPI0026E2D8E0|nr:MULTISPECIES: hypothetical protein [unclassified Neptuniibacter]MDO6515302.1 hypothetical protein [Neptuniibacter sp. 2_MG-2023]MDO6594299.1 hypothetical protein [Neptuniibacter sp. 1_MG-2023]